MYRILQTGMTPNYGGVESVVMNWYRHIDRSQFQFDFLVSHKYGKIAYEDEIISLGGHIYREYYGRKELPLGAAKRVERIFENDKDIVGVHMNLNTLEYITPLQIAKRRNLPVRIAHSHNAGNLNEHVRIETKIMQKINKQILKSRDYTKFACGELAAEYMFGKQVPHTIIHNAIDMEKYAYNAVARKNLRAELGIGEETTVIGFVGRLQYQKNPEFLLRIFECYHMENPDSNLLIVGSGPLENECRTLAKDAGLEERIHFLGSKKNVNEYYSVFDLLLLPSRFEGLAVVLIEAQAADLQCLISDTITKEVQITPLIEAESLLETPQKWAQHMKKMLNRKQRERVDNQEILSAAGYDISQEAKMLEKQYQRLLGGE